jgi:hypothetical protein
VAHGFPDHPTVTDLPPPADRGQPPMKIMTPWGSGDGVVGTEARPAGCSSAAARVD